ncbi:uncharacterized protein LODBEIA_P33540 [Lodderomyces beijingensis]|uniref:Nitrogen regulatory protein areA GATA-like domain-containing protein n=1 Tax=Lodderomyces beijingensis TaxID=1775926 RepID=A0ABP0ZLV7_9ASCO
MSYYNSLDDSVLSSSTNFYINTRFHQNIDYLDYVPRKSSSTRDQSQSQPQHYLQDNSNLLNFVKYINSNPDYKYGNTFLYQRLLNICWRRVFKNQFDLPELNPLTINWDKNSDITWLFGPRVEYPCESGAPASTSDACTSPSSSSPPPQQQLGTSVQEPELELGLELELEDRMSVSSYDSDSELDQDQDQDFIHTSSPAAAARKDSTCSTSSTSSSYYDANEEAPTNQKLKSILRTSTNDKRHEPRTKRSVTFNYIVNTREIIDNISLDYNFLDQNCI